MEIETIFESFLLQAGTQSAPSVSDCFPLLAQPDLYQNATQPKLMTNTAADIYQSQPAAEQLEKHQNANVATEPRHKWSGARCRYHKV